MDKLYTVPLYPAPAAAPAPAPHYYTLPPPSQQQQQQQNQQADYKYKVELEPQHAERPAQRRTFGRAKKIDQTPQIVPQPAAGFVFTNVSITYIDQQENASNVAKSEINQAGAKSKKSYKRGSIQDPNNWRCNVRKLKHQKGEAYVNRRGKFVPAKQIKNTKDCKESCKSHCSKYINDTDRQHIFKAFYSLNVNEKKHFLLNTTERHRTKKSRATSEEDRKRKYAFKYFFLIRDVRYAVCKNFYLGTLAISQKPVYNVHLFKSDMNIPKPDGRGSAPNSCHVLPDEMKDRIREHIRSFPVLDSHSCRPSKKLYLSDVNLNVRKMYKMYLEKCKREKVEWMKESMYRKIFTTEFNLHFKTKKKNVERCDMCNKKVKGE